MRFALAICRSMPLLLFAPQSFKHHYRWGREKKEVTNKSVFDAREEERAREKKRRAQKHKQSQCTKATEKKLQFKKYINSEQKHKQNAQSMFHHFGFVRVCFFFFSSLSHTHTILTQVFFPCIGFIIIVIIILFVVPLFKRKDIKLPGKSFE